MKLTKRMFRMCSCRLLLLLKLAERKVLMKGMLKILSIYNVDKHL